MIAVGIRFRRYHQGHSTPNEPSNVVIALYSDAALQRYRRRRQWLGARALYFGVNVRTYMLYSRGSPGLCPCRSGVCWLAAKSMLACVGHWRLPPGRSPGAVPLMLRSQEGKSE